MGQKTYLIRDTDKTKCKHTRDRVRAAIIFHIAQTYCGAYCVNRAASRLAPAQSWQIQSQ